MSISKITSIITLVLFAVLLSQSPVFAGEKKPDNALDLAGLEKQFLEISKKVTSSTVLIRVIIGPGRMGFGSGAVISSDGYILTCSHVSSPAWKLEVVLPDGRVFEAKKLGENYKNDYSLIKIDAEDLKPFKIGSSGDLKKGDWVMALGHPGGPNADVKPAFSVGRVTGLGKRLPVQGFARYYVGAVQTDIPIFAGNSGGPLVNMKGELVGINGAILLINENSYAVAIDKVKPNLEKMKKGENAEGEGPKEGDFAALLKDTEENFQGDDLKKFFNQQFQDFQLDDTGKIMRKMLELFAQGQDPETRRMMERLGKLLDPDSDISEELKRIFEKKKPGKKPAEPGKKPALPPGKRPVIGLRVLPVSDQARGVLCIEYGLSITEVVPEMPADKGGLRETDVVLSVNGIAMHKPEDLGKVLSRSRAGESLEFRILRRKMERIVYVIPVSPEPDGGEK